MFRRMVGFFVFLVFAGPLIGALLATALGLVTGPHRWLVLGVALLVVIGFVLLARRFFGRSWGPVGQLIDATRRLGEGESGVRIEIRQPGPLAAVSGSFNRMAARLEEEDERRRRLLADLGHELRTPLTVIRGEIEAVVDGLHDPSALSNVLDEVDLMERLLEDLRVLALAEAGRLQLHPEPTDLPTLVAEVLASFASTLETHHVDTEVVSEDLPELDLDRHRLHQVVSNLVANAVQHMADGGKLAVTTRREPGWAVVEVADTGPGIDQERLEHIFERFVKAGDSTGTGLGLSIARDLVEAHGGTLTASNRVEDGAVFTIRLPDRS